MTCVPTSLMTCDKNVPPCTSPWPRRPITTPASGMLCATYGLRFSTCYIGNEATGESFQRYQPLWSNRADCCDAVGNVQAFQTTCASLQRSSFIPLTQVAPGT